MVNFLLTILISVTITLASAFGIYNYLPLSALESLQSQESRLGATITVINGSDTISSSRTTINDNFTNLNNGKIENASTSLRSLLRAENLAYTNATRTATILEGRWTANTIQSDFGGTGTTSMSQYRVVLGNGTGSTTVATSTGTNGQVFTSSGEGVGPSWVSLPPTNEASNYSWTGQHRFNIALNASSTLLVNSRLSVATSSPSTLRNLLVEGGALIGGTTTLSRLVIASSTLEANGLIYTLPSSQSTTSIAVNDGNGVLSFQRITDGSATTSNAGFTGNLVFQHGLGRMPTMLKITAISRIDSGGTLEVATSYGVATSTGTQGSNQSNPQMIIGQTVRAAATIAYTTPSTNAVIIDLQDTGGASSFTASLRSWTSTTFTLNVSTNATGANEDTRKILWEIW